MLDDIDLCNPAIREELKRWGKWYFETTRINGFSLNAIKHVDTTFFNEWLDYLLSELKHQFFTVGEYLAPYDLQSILDYIEVTNGRMSLFDAPL